MGMKVMVIGSGGREHALIWKINQSQKVERIYALPGNAGIEEYAKCIDIKQNEIEKIVEFAVKERIDLAVIGPEEPLAMGIVDMLENEGVKTFGPNKECSMLEASKSFTKDFLKRHDIPTAKYVEYTSKADALENIGIFGYPMVIKADGLAAGKGVIIAKNEKEAVEAIEELMESEKFGNAGKKIVVEEFMDGIEASLLCFVDENTIIPMETAQDYKRIFDNDCGENTGGMGAYSPSKVIDDNLLESISKKILKPTLEGFKEDKLKFKGVLFIGLMISDGQAKVVEFNNRFGDPETQAVLMRMESDIIDIMEATIENKLNEIKIEWKNENSVCVILASGGYPREYEKGKCIKGIKLINEKIKIFHSGTKRNEKGDIVTWGGRVLGVTGLGMNLDEAIKNVYSNVEKIEFDDMQYRKDIGKIRV